MTSKKKNTFESNAVQNTLMFVLTQKHRALKYRVVVKQ